MIGFQSTTMNSFQTFDALRRACLKKDRLTSNRELSLSNITINSAGVLSETNDEGETRSEVEIGHLTLKTLRDVCRRLSVPPSYLTSVDDAEFASTVLNQRVSEKGETLGRISLRVEIDDDVSKIIGVTGPAYRWYRPSELSLKIRNLIRNSPELTMTQGFMEAGTVRCFFSSGTPHYLEGDSGDVVEFGVSICNSCDGHRSLRITPYCAIKVSESDDIRFRATIASTIDGKRVIHIGSEFDAKVNAAFASTLGTISNLRIKFLKVLENTKVGEEGISLISKYISSKFGDKRKALLVLDASMGTMDILMALANTISPSLTAGSHDEIEASIIMDEINGSFLELLGDIAAGASVDGDVMIDESASEIMSTVS